MLRPPEDGPPASHGEPFARKNAISFVAVLAEEQLAAHLTAGSHQLAANAMALFRLGQAHFDLREYDAARRAFERPIAGNV